MYRCFETEIKGRFYPKLIRRLRDQFANMANEINERLQYAIKQGLIPVDGVYQKVFLGDHRLFAVPMEARKSAQDIIEEGIDHFKCMKSMIQGTTN
jgi:uncharacterized protein (DUF924 family)